MKRIFYACVTVLTLSLLVGALLASGSSKVSKRSVELAYQFEIGDISPSSQKIVAWVPIPPSNAFQHLRDFKVEGPWDREIETDLDYKNKILKLTFRGDTSGPTASLNGRIVFNILRKTQSGFGYGSS